MSTSTSAKHSKDDPSQEHPAVSMTGGEMAMNGAKAVADFGVMPGLSHLLAGDIKTGLLHAVGALAAGALLGPLGYFGVAANSVSKSVSGKGIVYHFKNKDKD